MGHINHTGFLSFDSQASIMILLDITLLNTIVTSNYVMWRRIHGAKALVLKEISPLESTATVWMRGCTQSCLTRRFRSV